MNEKSARQCYEAPETEVIRIVIERSMLDSQLAPVPGVQDEEYD